MKVLNKRKVTKAQAKNSTWHKSLKAWLTIFEAEDHKFTTYDDIRKVWPNVDRVPAIKTKRPKSIYPIYFFDVDAQDTAPRIISYLDEQTSTITVVKVCDHDEYDRWWKAHTT